MIHAERVATKGGGVAWLLFRDGEWAKPLAMLTDYEMDKLLAEIDDQEEDTE